MQPHRAYERYVKRADHSRELAQHLDRIASTYADNTQELLRGLSHRISLCASKHNHRLVRDGDDAYVTSFWHCNSKLCPECSARRGLATRRVLRDRIATAPPAPNEKLYFITLTVPNIGQKLRASRAIVNHAWSLFRKRKLWVASVSGGSKTEEFTLTPRGYHYHLHLLAKSTYLHYQEIRRVWTECVEAAYAEAKLPFTVRTRDGLLIIKGKVVHDMPRSLFEVTKYVTKTSSWSRLNATELVECALIERWHRMFETFGDWAQHEQRDTPASDRTERAKSESIVHNELLSDGTFNADHFTGWRRVILRHGFHEFTYRLAVEYAERHRFQLQLYEERYPNLALTPLT